MKTGTNIRLVFGGGFCAWLILCVQKEDEFKKEHWEGRGGGERWERGDGGQTRQNSGRGSWDWSEGRQPENHERSEWSGRGSRRNWEEQQHNTRKRPHTPPPTHDKKWTKSNEKSPREGDPKGISKVKRHFSARTFCLGRHYHSILVFLLLLLRL
jgi:hypothetical protein